MILAYSHIPNADFCREQGAFCVVSIPPSSRSATCHARALPAPQEPPTQEISTLWNPRGTSREKAPLCEPLDCCDQTSRRNWGHTSPGRERWKEEGVMAFWDRRATFTVYMGRKEGQKTPCTRLYTECFLPTNSYVEIPTPCVMVLGSWAFGRWLDHVGRALKNVISDLIKRPPESPLTQSTRWGHSEKTADSEPESRSQVLLILLVPWSWIPSFQNGET